MDKKGICIGIEFGSTRIKAVAVDCRFNVAASGGFEWENQIENGYFTYEEESIWQGLSAAYLALKDDYLKKAGVPLKDISCIGISGMMHGYIALDKSGKLLVPFRTWRNTTTAEAAETLTREFGFNIPQRWSVAHLYQAMLSGERHVKEIDFITTLAGYVHFRLTGKRVVGMGEASGMFPIGPGGNYDGVMLDKFDRLTEENKMPFKIRDILPKALSAGENAGRLTEEGARLLDPSGETSSGILLCPPEGDAGTGMVATNSVRERTGNVSAGTSVFAMVTTGKSLSRVYPEIDTVTTPDGKPVAMVHCNNCTSDINAFAGLFAEVINAVGFKCDKSKLMAALFEESDKADADIGGLLSYCFYSGEPIAGLTEGRPLFIRRPDSRFNLANFMRGNIYSALATLAMGMRILKNENIEIDDMRGHGGFFKTPGVGQRAVSAAVGAPVTLTQTAGEGGAYGIALLAAYAAKSGKKSLAEFLDEEVFAKAQRHTESASAKEVKDFAAYLERFEKGLPLERAAVEADKC